jgi:hypothetical protein
VPENFVEEREDRPLYSLNRMQETELPASIKLAYIEPGRDYRQAAVESRRSTGSSRRETLVALPASLSQAAAQTSADTMLFHSWSGRESASFILPPSCLRFEPGDGVELVTGDMPLSLRIEEISEGYARSVKARGLDCDIYGPGSSPARAASASLVEALGPPALVFMDLPLLTSTASEHGLWLAATSDPWSSGLAVYRKNGSAYELNRSIASPAVMGETLDALPQGPLWRRDRSTRLRVRLYRGGLQSIGEEELLNGGNLAAIGDAATGFEIVQFEKASLIASSTYEISTLLRGQLGSSPEMLDARQAGSSFVLIDKSVVQLSMSAADLGLSIIWRTGPASLTYGDASFREDAAVPSGRALRPLPPCRLKARRSGSDVLFTWTRQTRIDGDNWELADVPLGETSETYLLQILDGGAVKRSLTLSEPSYLYSEAGQLADLGATPSIFTISVSQLSATYGAGASAKAELNV